jgi:hypothetical protein
MSAEIRYPGEQRKLLVDHLVRDIRGTADSAGVEVETAFLDVCIRDLGYDKEHGYATDGSGDFGFDFVDISDREAFVFQSKSVDADALNEYDGANVVGPEKLGDLQRIASVLRHLDEIPENSNTVLRRALEELRIQISRAGRAIEHDEKNGHGDELREPPYTVTVVLVCLGQRLSAQAAEEFEKITKSNSADYCGIKVGLQFQLKLVDDIISERWRKENDIWRDRTGKKREKVRLSIFESQVLHPGQSYVFFTRAHDLVKAYEDFGYQIFEPNVRAEIHNSPVNKEIKRSVSSRKGRLEFRHLNNGITIIAQSVHGVGPKDKLTALEISQPGIVNGLQTVKSLHDGFKELTSPQDQAHFEQHCAVLCRVHGLQSVTDVAQLIKATNNQNAMKPRNLLSNNPEQLIYEQLFAELSWFYQRKEGGWRAFKGNPKGWPKIGGRQPRDFKSGKAERVVDNEEIAQNWLSFIGYSKEAINQRKFIFSSDTDDLYRLCFMLTPAKHAYHHSYRMREGIEASSKDSPSAGALLFAQLIRNLYEATVPGPKEARSEAITRLGIKPGLPKEELETKLINDDRYMTNRVMNGTKTLFVEFVGFIMLEVWGPKFQALAPSVMSRGAFGELFQNTSVDPAKSVLSAGRFSTEDAVIAIFKLYEECIYRLVTDPSWKRQYDAANVKSRFLYEDKNRQRLIEELRTVDQLIGRRGLGQPWSDMFDEAGGVFDFFKSWLSKGEGEIDKLRSSPRSAATHRG